MEGYSLQIISSPIGAYVPVVGITQAAGLALIAQVQAGSTIVAKFSTKLSVTTTWVTHEFVKHLLTIYSYNVIAQTIGGDPENVIHISGHSDSVAAGKIWDLVVVKIDWPALGPGINDNGSGTISILEVAEALTNFSVTNAVRFSWYGRLTNLLFRIATNIVKVVCRGIWFTGCCILRFEELTGGIGQDQTYAWWALTNFAI